LNCCIFAGRLTKDCEVRQTQNGKSVGNYTLAIDDGYGENKRTLFLNCVHWNVEKIANYLVKGKAVIVRGKLQQREYTDKEGQQRKIIELNVQESSFQQGSSNSNGNSNGNGNRGQQRQPQTAADTDSCPF